VSGRGSGPSLPCSAQPSAGAFRHSGESERPLVMHNDDMETTRPDPGQKVRYWLLISAAMLLVGLVNFGIQVTSWLASYEHNPVKYAFAWEMTGALAFLALLPVLLAFFRRFPITRETAWRRIPLYLTFMVLLAAAQTVLMWLSRTILYDALGWGRYDYGDMRYRVPMEAFKLLFGYWGVFAVVAAVNAARRQREREVAAARLEQQLTAARLATLKAQLNPHFLFNTLNTISSLVYDNPKAADEMLAHLADFLRMTLRHAEVQEVALRTELEFLDAYLAIMRSRFEDRLVVELTVEDEARDALLPHLLLQPLVENAVTHAMTENDRPARIGITAVQLGERLRLVVTDNGPGLAGNGTPRLGVGLGNTGARLTELYGAEHRLELANRAEGGLEVTVELPFRLAGTEKAP
jgi:two-component system, LytTR family, sensor kinase